MEQELATQQQPEPTGLIISHRTEKSLLAISGWTKFIAIVGFIFLGLMVLFGFSMGSIMSKTMPGDSDAGTIISVIMGFSYLVIAGIYFYPIFALLKFSILSQRAVRTKNNNDIDEAFSFLKGHYTYVGVLMLIGLIFMLIEIIAILFVFSAMGGLSNYLEQYF